MESKLWFKDCYVLLTLIKWTMFLKQKRKKEVLWRDTEALEEMKIYLLHYSISLYPQSNVVEREFIIPSEYNNSGKSKAASLRQIQQVLQVCLPCSFPLCSPDPSFIRALTFHDWFSPSQPPLLHSLWSARWRSYGETSTYLFHLDNPRLPKILQLTSVYHSVHS